MIILDATTQTVTMTTSTGADVDYYVSYVDITSSAFTPGTSVGTATTATTTTILSAPAASTQRQVKYISITNIDTTSQTVTIKHDTSGTGKSMTSEVNLGASESLQYTQSKGWQAYTAGGRLKSSVTPTAISGQNVAFYFSEPATMEGAGVYHAFSLISNCCPGVFTLGSPGLNGTTVTGTQGQLPVTNPSTGSNRITSLAWGSTTTASLELIDILWYNSGITVTTTTAQSITFSGLPARDINETTDGVGVYAALFVSATSTNGANPATTISYTNSSGTAGRTGTIGPVSSTSRAGCWYKFTLQAGDVGIRSIQSITLGTSWATGSLSLVCYRPILFAGQPADNLLQTFNYTDNVIPLPNDVCLNGLILPTSTTIRQGVGNIVIVEDNF